MGKFPGFCKLSAFTLVELMMVVSIMSLIISMSLSPFYKLKIQAARTEVGLNFRAIQALTKSYSVDTDNSLPSITNYGNAVVGSLQIGSCATNTLGFSAPNCLQLRYIYSLVGGSSNQSYSIIARSTTMSGGVIQFGNPIIRHSLCKIGAVQGYNDIWQFIESNQEALLFEIAPGGSFYCSTVNCDMLQQCLQ